MPSLPIRSPATPVLVKVEPLTSTAFAPFGTAIVSPVSQDVTAMPSLLPTVEQKPHQPRPQPANQNTALKTSPVSSLVNNYPGPDTSTGRSESKGVMSIFSCFPRRNLYTDKHNGKLKLRIAILERHPYTTQTFCPFNYSATTDRTAGGHTYFLVVVAPTLSDPTSTPANPPDLSRLRAFLAPTVPDGSPGMAVTYNAGTWHAPMVVLGERRIDFLVSQFANGLHANDCQEVLVGSGSDVVEVDVSGLGLEDAYLWKKAKL